MGYLDRDPDEIVAKNQERKEAAKEYAEREAAHIRGGATLTAVGREHQGKNALHPDQINHDNLARAERDRAERDAETFAN